MAQFLTTQHSARQGARQAPAMEGSGRTTSFRTTISAAIVAPTLDAQLARFRDVFLLFSLVPLPAPLALAVAAGAVVFLLAAGVQYWLAVRWTARLHEHFPPRFPAWSSA